MSINGNNLPTKLLKKASGEVYLTTRRFIFLCNDNKDLHSFSGDFASLSNIEVGFKYSNFQGNCDGYCGILALWF